MPQDVVKVEGFGQFEVVSSDRINPGGWPAMFLNRLVLQSIIAITSRLNLTTDSNVNIFVGPNAQGKTNLLESIFVLALTKSHRTIKDKELIGWNGEQHASACGKSDKRYGSCKLDLSISTQGKKAKINGLEQRKLSDFIGALNVVMFAPEDLEIVKGTPGIRRRFLDMEIGQVQPGYLHDLSAISEKSCCSGIII